MDKEIFVNKKGVKKLGIHEKFPDFALQGILDGDVKIFSGDTLAGKWAVLFFYPSDFSPTSSSEIKELSDSYEKISSLGASVYVIGGDSVSSHKAWISSDNNLQDVKNIPLLSDSFYMLSRFLGLLDKKNGGILRATYVLDPEGVLRFFEKGDSSIKRSIPDLLKKIEAMQALEKIKIR
jgi:alkyl hydroperoxide reductase subunit AhpC